MPANYILHSDSSIQHTARGDHVVYNAVGLKPLACYEYIYRKVTQR